MAKPVKPDVPPPALRSDPATFRDRAEANVAFFQTLVDYMDANAGFTEEQADAAIAAALAGDLPPIAGQALKLMRINAAGTGIEFLDPKLTALALLAGTEFPRINNASVTDNSIAPGPYAYIELTGSTGGPDGETLGHVFHYRRSPGGGEAQTFISDNTTNANMYVRRRGSGLWGSWQKVLTLADIASQAQAEAGTDNTTVMTPLRTAQAIAALGKPECTVNFNGQGTVSIRDSGGNIASITDDGLGSYTVNFTDDLPDANYSPLAVAGSADGSRATCQIRNLTVSGFNIYVINHGNGLHYDPTWVSAVVFKH